jgi:hypothetical protein
MPIRSSARGFAAGSRDELGAAERAFANQFSSVWVGIPDDLQILLHDPHFVCIFQQSLRAGIAADDALPADAK